MAEFFADDRARERRLAEIRSRRGSAEREAHIAEIAEKKQAAAKKKPSSKSTQKKTRENSTEYHGHSWDEWDQMRDVGLALIAERAAKREFVSYGAIWDRLVAELGKPLGNSHFQWPSLMEHMAEKSLADSQLIAAALVVDEDSDGSPGVGFFRLAAAKGLIPAEAAPEKGAEWAMSESQRQFWQQQVDGMFALHAG